MLEEGSGKAIDLAMIGLKDKAFVRNDRRSEGSHTKASASPT